MSAQIDESEFIQKMKLLEKQLTKIILSYSGICTDIYFVGTG